MKNTHTQSRTHPCSRLHVLFLSQPLIHNLPVDQYFVDLCHITFMRRKSGGVCVSVSDCLCLSVCAYLSVSLCCVDFRCPSVLLRCFRLYPAVSVDVRVCLLLSVCLSSVNVCLCIEPPGCHRRDTSSSWKREVVGVGS